MSKTFYNIDDNMKEELNDYFGLRNIDFTTDNELYELLDQYHQFRDYEISSVEDFSEKVCIWDNFDNYCENTIDEWIYMSVEDEYVRDKIFSCLDYNKYYRIVFSSSDMNELSNGVIVEILD